jgi:hypothetical protein
LRENVPFRESFAKIFSFAKFFAKIFHLEYGSGFRSHLNVYPYTLVENFRKNGNFSRKPYREQYFFPKTFAKSERIFAFRENEKTVFVSTLIIPYLEENSEKSDGWNIGNSNIAKNLKSQEQDPQLGDPTTPHCAQLTTINQSYPTPRGGKARLLRASTTH